MSAEEPGNPPGREPTEEELRQALEQLRVEDVLLQTVVTLVNLTGSRLTAEGDKDLDQARQGIEAVRALLPLCPQDELGPVRDAMSQLQMMYVRETGGPGGQEAVPPAGAGGEVPAQPPGGGEAPQPPPQPQQPPQEKPPSRIWTPPGS